MKRNWVQGKFLQIGRMPQVRMAVWGIFALAWFGVCFPELYFTEETYQAVMVVDGKEIPLQNGDLKDFLCAENDKIVIKSKVLEWFEERFFSDRDEVKECDDK